MAAEDQSLDMDSLDVRPQLSRQRSRSDPNLQVSVSVDSFLTSPVVTANPDDATATGTVEPTDRNEHEEDEGLPWRIKLKPFRLRANTAEDTKLPGYSPKEKRKQKVNKRTSLPVQREMFADVSADGDVKHGKKHLRGLSKLIPRARKRGDVSPVAPHLKAGLGEEEFSDSSVASNDGNGEASGAPRSFSLPVLNRFSETPDTIVSRAMVERESGRQPRASQQGTPVSDDSPGEVLHRSLGVRETRSLEGVSAGAKVTKSEDSAPSTIKAQEKSRGGDVSGGSLSLTDGGPTVDASGVDNSDSRGEPTRSSGRKRFHLCKSASQGGEDEWWFQIVF